MGREYFKKIKGAFFRLKRKENALIQYYTFILGGTMEGKFNLRIQMVDDIGAEEMDRFF